MSIHTDLAIHKTGTDLLGHVAGIHAQLPRGYKKMIGDKIVDHCSDMLDLMAMANATRHAQRATHIRNLLAHQRAALVWLRVGFNLKKISTEAWARAVEMLNSVGKQANGWLNKTNATAPAA